MLRTFAVLMAVGGALVAAAPSPMQMAAPPRVSPYSMTFSDPSVLPGFAGGVQIESFSFDEAHSTSPGSSQRASGPGRVTITRTIDRASPLLERAIARGPIGDLKLTAPDQTIVLTNVVVTHVVHSAKGESPTESITFEFGGLQIRYTSPTPTPTPAALIRTGTVPLGPGAVILPTPAKSP